MLPKGKQWEEMDIEEGFVVWFCSSTEGCWTAVLDKWAETTSWRASLLFVNGGWTTSLDKVIWLRWQIHGKWGEPYSSFWVGSSWFDQQDVKESMGTGLRLSLKVAIPIQKMIVIFISFTRGCSDRCELLGCYGSANWDMLSEVWYSRKRFLARKRGPVLWNDGFSDFIVLTCFYSSY